MQKPAGRPAPPVTPQQAVAAGSLAITALGLTLLLWMPVARRLSAGFRDDVVLVDTATMPGLAFRPGEEGNPGMVRLAAIVCVLAVLACLASCWVSVVRDADYVHLAWGAALANLVGVALFLTGAHTDERSPFVDRIEATSGWVAWALLPCALALATRLMVPDTRPPGSLR